MTREVIICCCKLLKKKQFCFPLNIPAPDQGYIRGPNGNYFHVVNQMVSWTTAKAHCEAKNGSLAILNSPDLVRFSIDFLDDTRVWIGATDEQEEGNWMWMNGQKVKHPMEYSSFRAKTTKTEDHFFTSQFLTIELILGIWY